MLKFYATFNRDINEQTNNKLFCWLYRYLLKFWNLFILRYLYYLLKFLIQKLCLHNGEFEKLFNIHFIFYAITYFSTNTILYTSQEYSYLFTYLCIHVWGYDIFIFYLRRYMYHCPFLIQIYSLLNKQIFENQHEQQFIVYWYKCYRHK